jgi:hypothetical protein
MTRFIALLSAAIPLLLAFDADATQQRVTGYVKSLDDQAHRITLGDGTVFPIKPDADTSWIVPGTKVDLICDYDAIGIIGCGVGLAALSDDLNQKTGNQGTSNQGTSDQPPTGAGTGFSNELGYQTPDANLPDKPTESIFNIFRRQDK